MSEPEFTRAELEAYAGLDPATPGNWAERARRLAAFALRLVDEREKLGKIAQALPLSKANVIAAYEGANRAERAAHEPVDLSK